MTPKSLLSSIRALPFTAGMPPEFASFLCGCAANRRLAAGEYLFREEGEANAIAIVRRGAIDLEVHVPARGRVVLETLVENDVLGWSALVPPYRWHVDARATHPSVVLSFDAECIRRKMEAELPFAYELTRRLLASVHRRLERVRLHQLDAYSAEVLA